MENMGCSIISDDIKVVMEQTDSQFNPAQGSALQNPELSRVQLLTMLRRTARNASTRRKKQWATFMVAYKSQEPANSNR